MIRQTNSYRNLLAYRDDSNPGNGLYIYDVAKIASIFECGDGETIYTFQLYD